MTLFLNSKFVFLKNLKFIISRYIVDIISFFKLLGTDCKNSVKLVNGTPHISSKIKLYDYVIKNDDLEKTVNIIMTIIENEVKLEKI